jgi:hypothetical protein
MEESQWCDYYGSKDWSSGSITRKIEKDYSVQRKYDMLIRIWRWHFTVSPMSVSCIIFSWEISSWFWGNFETICYPVLSTWKPYCSSFLNLKHCRLHSFTIENSAVRSLVLITKHFEWISQSRLLLIFSFLLYMPEWVWSNTDSTHTWLQLDSTRTWLIQVFLIGFFIIRFIIGSFDL